MFKAAERKKSKLRMALIGPSGSGKTYTALTIGAALGTRVALIDTERGSASKYAGDVARFDVAELEVFSPKHYVEAIEAAGAAGYEVLIIDSLSHAWAGQGGALEMVDKAKARSNSANSFTAWRDVTPQHNALVDAILRYPGHVIATMRAKTEWVLEDVGGKKVPRKIGMAPVQRDGVEYEFDVVADMDHEHRFVVSKSRCQALSDAVISKPDREVAETLRAWLDDGVPPRLAPPKHAAKQQAKLSDCADELQLREWLRAYGAKLTESNVQRVVKYAEDIGIGGAEEWVRAQVNTEAL